MNLIHSDLEAIQRENQARRIGFALYTQAAAISLEPVDAVSAVVNRMEALHGATLDSVAEEFARAMVADRADDHLVNLRRRA